MKLIPKALFVVFVAASLFRTALLAGQSLEIRVAPSDVIYTNQNNRRTGIYDIMVQTISVINNSDRSVTLEEILIEVVEEGDVILTDRLLAKNYEPVWKAFYPYYSNPETQKSDNSLVLFSEVLPEGVTVSPTLTLGPNTAILVRNRLLALSGYLLPDTVRVSATLADAAGKLETAETSLPVVRYEARNEFIFPLRGRWYVSSSSSIRSHHRARPAHEFALDLMKIGEGGRSFRTDGSSPEDYYAFGKDVLAIADGTVIAAEKEIAETEMPKTGEARGDFARRVLGAMWEQDPTGRIAGGNYVVIEHQGAEYSVYVHMRHNSVTVVPGDKVKQGQVIGQVGISGDGFEPHLHFSVTNTPDMNYGHGLPITFTNVKPVGLSSTIDMNVNRLFLTGEFVDASDPP
ncbi:MAG: M23 family metallopeptidase, partial [Phycisphaerae bacterium]